MKFTIKFGGRLLPPETRRQRDAETQPNLCLPRRSVAETGRKLRRELCRYLIVERIDHAYASIIRYK